MPYPRTQLTEVAHIEQRILETASWICPNTKWNMPFELGVMWKAACKCLQAAYWLLGACVYIAYWCLQTLRVFGRDVVDAEPRRTVSVVYVLGGFEIDAVVQAANAHAVELCGGAEAE